VFSSLDGVTNLDVRSNLVINFNEAVTAVALKKIRVVNDGGVGFRAEQTTHSFEIDVTDTTQVTILGGRITLNPTFDLDLTNNYHIEIDAGAFTGATSSLPSAAISDNTTLNFSTVTPGVLLGNTVNPQSQTSVQAFEMTSSGTLQNSLKWLDVSGVGTPGSAQGTSSYFQIDASTAEYAFVVKDINTATGSGVGSDINFSTPTAIKFNNFGGGDLFYIDNQENQALASLKVDVDDLFFSAGDPNPASFVPYEGFANDGSAVAFVISSPITINPANNLTQVSEVVLNNGNAWSTTGMIISA